MTSFYQFRVKNCFFLCSNSDKAQSAARRAAEVFGAEVQMADDTDTSVSGGFILKILLSKSVKHHLFINAFIVTCKEEGLEWGSSADISELQ